MKAHLFRQAVVERLSSPEHLDEIGYHVAPMDWAIIGSVIVLLSTVAAWSLYGSVQTVTQGQGMLVPISGLLVATASGSGHVTELTVHPGDRIHRGQILARISQPALTSQIGMGEQALAEARDEADRFAELQVRQEQLKIAALENQLANVRRDIERVRGQMQSAAEELNRQEQLFKLKLITRQGVDAAQAKLDGLKSDEDRLKAQLAAIEADQFSARAARTAAVAQAESHVADSRRQVEALRQNLARSSVVTSDIEGEVVEVKTNVGATVAAGAPLVTVQPSGSGIEVVTYVSASEAKLVRTGLTVQITPSTVKREKYGYAEGTVVSVAQFPSTEAALMRSFENESLVKSMLANGPVTEVRAVLIRDTSTPSGFRWSSGSGPRITLSTGTLCSARVVTNLQKPIELILPFLEKSNSTSGDAR